MILYAVCCGVASLGLAMAFGLAAQLIFLPVACVGGLLLGRHLA